MKKLKNIIATLFVVAIGATMFFSCQKEEITSKTSSLNTSKTELHQKSFVTHWETRSGLYYDYELGRWMIYEAEVEVVDGYGYIVGGRITITIQYEPGEEPGDIFPRTILFSVFTTNPGTIGEFTHPILMDNYELMGLPAENPESYINTMVYALNN